MGEGAEVAICARDADVVQQAVEALSADGGKVSGAAVDVTVEVAAVDPAFAGRVVVVVFLVLARQREHPSLDVGWTPQTNFSRRCANLDSIPGPAPGD